MIIAQISDLHARPPGRRAYGVDTNTMLARTVASLLSLDPAPDCVIVTGDLTDCGLPDEYEVVQAQLARLPMPVFAVPGNHDRREAFCASLRERHGYLPHTGFQHYAIENFPVRLIGLDTVVPGEDGGEICREREEWLASCLARGNGRPTLVFMHHPPFATGVDGMDEILCRTAPSFMSLVARHPEIERIACGHDHRVIQVRWAGTLGFVGPSTAHQVALDLRPGQPNRFVMEPPGFALHVWKPQAGLVTHLQPIGDFGSRFDVALDPDYPGRHAIA